MSNSYAPGEKGGGALDGVVHNRIAHSLFRRVSRAIRDQEDFRVIVVVPVHMYGQGDLLTNPGLPPVVHYQALTVFKGPQSLLRRLAAAHPDCDDLSRYIFFACLRAHCSPGVPPLRRRRETGRPRETNLLYVHTKLLIADDRVVICGSANINDRSQMGDRDSEVCLMMRTAAGAPGSFARSLRIRLMAEHCGFLPSCHGDGPVPNAGGGTAGGGGGGNDGDAVAVSATPVCGDGGCRLCPRVVAHDVAAVTADVLRDPLAACAHFVARSVANTRLYDRVYPGEPHNGMRTLDQYIETRKWSGVSNLSEQERRPILRQVKGSAVLWPLHFLENADLGRTFASRLASLVGGTSVFT